MQSNVGENFEVFTNSMNLPWFWSGQFNPGVSGNFSEQLCVPLILLKQNTKITRTVQAVWGLKHFGTDILSTSCFALSLF